MASTYSVVVLLLQPSYLSLPYSSCSRCWNLVCSEFTACLHSPLPRRMSHDNTIPASPRLGSEADSCREERILALCVGAAWDLIALVVGLTGECRSLSKAIRIHSMLTFQTSQRTASLIERPSIRLSIRVSSFSLPYGYSSLVK